MNRQDLPDLPPAIATPSLFTLPTEVKRSTPTQPLPIHPSTQSKLKRWIDITGALIGLLLTGLLFIPIAIAIKLDSPGPIFYRQSRCGYRGQVFQMWKFRSMIHNADRIKHLVTNQATGHIFKNENDPRITKVGRLLRRTSLDELPQFWNILTGEMSLVGSRPPSLDEVQYYADEHWARLNVKPGLTGEWQVYGRSSIADFEAIVQLDLRYQHRWSIGYDLRLLCKTIQVVLFQQGAC